MSINDRLKLRYIVGIIAIIIIAILTYTQAINSSAGLATIVAILAALGLYEGVTFVRGS